MGRRALLAAVLLALSAPGAASAATVRVAYLGCDRYGYCATERRYAAVDGEANDVTLRIAGDEKFVSDAGAPLVTGGGCRALTEHEAVCGGGLPELELGDGDDRAQVVGDPSLVYVHAGPGADEVTGGPGTEHITGGPGADTLSGGPGGDLLFDGVRERFEADVFDGGDGRDLVSWQGRRRKVVAAVDAAGPVSSPGEGDRLVAVEDLAGGAGGDRLRGDEGSNYLVGGAGADRLDGGDGNDWLVAGAGDDVLSGGNGEDFLNPDVSTGYPGDGKPSGSDRLLCGADHDRAHQVLARDRVADDCERLRPYGVADGFDLLLPMASLDAPVLRVHVYVCALDRACHIEMSVRSGGRLLGRRRARVPGVARGVPLRLSRRGRRILRREGRLSATIAFKDGAGLRGAWTVVLRTPAPDA